MTPYTKPCARADRGCARLVVRTTQYALDHATFCSRRCNGLSRAESAPIPAERRAAGGRLGARRSAETRRRRAVQRRAAEVLRFLPRDLRDGLSDPELRRLQVLVGRVWADGHTRGYAAGYRARPNARTSTRSV